jgi:aryl-alcohol dehydrogenase-like predicted oxidoreductase
LSKLILGTAQFSPNYGITNKIGSLKQKNINQIISLYKKKKFKFIEISSGYKNAAHKLVKTKNLNNIRFIFKVNYDAIKNKEFSKRKKYLEKYLKLFNIKKFDYFLIQNFDKYSTENNIINDLHTLSQNLKLSGMINNFGISSYKFFSIKFLNKLKIDCIQLPFNIFDQRLIINNYHKKLKRNNIKIFVRSVFLQGLLLEDYENLNNKFLRYKNYFYRFENYCYKKKISKIDCCICFVKKFKEIEGIIVGALSSYELYQSIKSYKKNIKINFKPVLNEKLINVLLW